MLGKIYQGLQDGNLTTNLVDNLLWKENEKIYVKKDTPTDIDKTLENFKKWYMNKQGYSRIEDPTFLSFKIIIDWNSPLFRENTKRVNVRERKVLGTGESLAFYLESINQDWRKEKLLSFKRKMKELLSTRSHYMKTMEGLGAHWRFTPKTAFQEQELTIHTQESMDMFISSMADDYLQATYDMQNMKNVAPINLRYFDIIVVVHEIRNIKSLITNFDSFMGGDRRKMMEEHGGDANRNIIDEDGMVFLNPYLGIHAYRFLDCTFDFTDTMSYLSNISNEGGKEISAKFKIKLGRIDFRYHDLDPFSTSHRKQRFLQEVEPIVFERSSDEIERSRAVRRFTKEDENLPTKKLGARILDAVKKIAIDEARKTSKAVTRAIDEELQRTTSHATRAIKDKLNDLETNFRPSNFVGKHANRVASRLGRSARGLIDGTDASVGGVIDDAVNLINGTSPEEETERNVMREKKSGEEPNSTEATKEILRGLRDVEHAEYKFPENKDTTREQLLEIISENKTKFDYYKSVLEQTMIQNGK